MLYLACWSWSNFTSRLSLLLKCLYMLHRTRPISKRDPTVEFPESSKDFSLPPGINEPLTHDLSQFHQVHQESLFASPCWGARFAEADTAPTCAYKAIMQWVISLNWLSLISLSCDPQEVEHDLNQLMKYSNPTPADRLHSFVTILAALYNTGFKCFKYYPSVCTLPA